jgi:hypothetical protein
MRKFFDAVYDSAWRSGYTSSQGAPKAGRELFDTFFGGFR